MIIIITINGARSVWRAGFVLEEDPFIKGGNLKFGTLII